MLRGVAVLLVFCYHSRGALLVSRFGWVGVDLFFVLSGFLVSGLLFSEYRVLGKVRPGVFLARRGFKIYPQFYLLLFVTLVAAYASRTPVSISHIAAELFFFQNYAVGLWSHTWSLGVEEQFYLALTLALVLLARRGGPNPFRCVPSSVAVIAAGVLMLRVLTWWLGGPISLYRSVAPAHLRVDTLLCGVFISYAYTFEKERLAAWARRWRSWLAPLSIALLAPITFMRREDPFMVTVGFSMAACSFALLLINVLHPEKPAVPGRGFRIIAALGRISYAFYLWHGPVISWTEQMVTLPAWLEFILTFAVSWLIAALTTALIEQPLLALRNRWFPACRSAAQADPRPEQRPIACPDPLSA